MHPTPVSVNLDFYLQPAFVVAANCSAILAHNNKAEKLTGGTEHFKKKLLNALNHSKTGIELKSKPSFNGKIQIDGKSVEIGAFALDDQQFLLLLGTVEKDNNPGRNQEENLFELSDLLNSSSHVIWAVDSDFKLSYFNKKYQQRVKDRFGFDPFPGMLAPELENHVTSVNRDKWMQYYSLVWQNRKLHFEISFKDENGKEVWEDIFLNPIYNEANEISGVSAFSQTVTYKKQAERKIKDQTAKINSIFNSTAMLIWTMDKEMRISSYNNNFAKRLREICGTEVSIGAKFLDLVKPGLDEEEQKKGKELIEDALKGEIKRIESKLVSRAGNSEWIELFINPIYLESGRVKEISCIAHNITEKKIIEKQISDSLHEKEVLLQEVHHRVKNNLQVISSILNLQTSYVKDKNTLEILRESQNRIRSMSFIHESLYQTKDFSSIDFSDYINALAKNLVHSYSIGAAKITLTTDIEKVVLNLDQAIPCGLILNELISNSLKYAFPDPECEGTIHLSIKYEGPNVVIEVRDNGIGLPEGFNLEKSDALGLQLVYTLTDQLDGQIEFDSEKGTRYFIKFAKL